MKNKTIVVIGLSTFLAGAFISKMYFTNQETIKTVTVNSATDCSSELAQAEEFYGKAFLLFLSSIGMNLNAQQNMQLQQVVQNPQAYIEQASVTPEFAVDAVAPTAVVTDTQVVVDEPVADANERPLPEDEGKNDLLFRAKKFELENPANYLDQSQAMGAKNKQLLKVNGQYEGKLHMLSGKYKGEIHQVDLNIAYTLESGKKPDGQYYLELSRDNDPYSTTNGTGSNEDIRLNPADPRAVILNASPSSFFHFANTELRLANYYYGGKKVGVAVFKRK